ncbi:MAG: hypothetical protein KAJ73_00785 [Zetaproteobacteria bacterium]|nr:hypothetical protein [Zetaproteobacteria bacterium]
MKDKVVTIESTRLLTTQDGLVISKGVKYRAIKYFIDHGKQFYYELIGAGDVTGVVLSADYAREILPLQVEIDNTDRKRKIKIRKVKALAK